MFGLKSIVLISCLLIQLFLNNLQVLESNISGLVYHVISLVYQIGIQLLSSGQNVVLSLKLINSPSPTPFDSPMDFRCAQANDIFVLLTMESFC